MPRRDDVYRITNAGHSLTADQSGRARRYLWSMAIRTACFVGAVVTTGWLRWALVAGAVLLPYLAVVVANAGRERTRDEDSLPLLLHTQEQIALPSRSVDARD